MAEGTKKIVKSIAAVGIFLTTIVSIYHYYQENSVISQVNAEMLGYKETKKNNLIVPTKWIPTYSYSADIGYTDVVKSSGYLGLSDPKEVNGWGTVTVKENNDLYLFNKRKDNQVVSGNSVFYKRPRVGVTQEVSLTVGRYYRYSFDILLKKSWPTDSVYYSFESKQVKKWGFWQNKDTWYNRRNSFLATSKVEEVFFYANPADEQYSSSDIKNIQLVDITDEVLSFISRIDALFIDETRGSIKLSTTQKKINELKSELSDYTNLLSATDKNTATIRLNEAQKLLDNINMILSVDTLEDNPIKPGSYTISGKTAPNSFLHFASDSQIITAGVISSEVEDDKTGYQIRADKNGNFQYKLPENTYFKADEIVTINSMLNGKTAIFNAIVKDTTPPVQPILHVLKDTDNSFSGDAEKLSTINVYDDLDKSLVVTGQAGIDGQFALSISEPKKILKPYKKYYVTATDKAGNVSINSAVQTVEDTIPPTALPVKQVLTLGEQLPALTKLISNIDDNAGAEQVLIELTKTPDLSKIGYTTAEITLTDAAKNKRKILVPIIVKDEKTVLDDTYLLDAQNFTIQAIYYPETEAEQRKFLLEQSKLIAWDIVKGENVNEQVTIDKSNILKKPGSYKISFQIGNIKKEITANLTVGDITFERIPTNLSFGTPIIQSKKQIVKPKDSISVSIMDTRFVTNDWRLYTQLSRPLETKDGNKISGGILFKQKNKDGEWMEEIIDDQQITEVFSKNRAVQGKTTIDFLGDKEIILSVLPGSVYSNKLYSTTVIWTLENAP